MRNETQVRERPILFSDPMTLALMDGRKTQTRRVRGLEDVNRNPDAWTLHRVGSLDYMTREPFKGRLGAYFHSTEVEPRTLSVCPAACPYGQPGDRLWVREAWQYFDWTEDGSPFIRYRAGGATVLHDYGSIPEEWGERVLDIWADLSKPENYRIDNRAADRRWRPSIHMPRAASRITLEITDVRVERVQEITEAGAQAEGIADGGCLTCGNSSHPNPCGCGDPRPDSRDAFAHLWDSLNAARGFGWQANPWVWVLTFQRVDGVA